MAATHSNAAETMAFDEDWEEYDPSKGNFVHHMIAGSAAGVAEHVGMFPLDTWRTFLQVHRGRGTSVTFGKLLREYGFVRLWRGAPVMISACVPAHAAYFSVYEVAKQRFGVNRPGHHPLAAGAAGAVATIMHDAVMTPMDVIKQRLQLGYYKGIIDCTLAIARQEGLPAFYRSFSATVLMNIPYASVVVATNESTKKLLQNTGLGDMHRYFLSGAAAGALAAVVTNPLDVLKTRLQTQRCCAPAFNADIPPADGACKADPTAPCPAKSHSASAGVPSVRSNTIVSKASSYIFGLRGRNPGVAQLYSSSAHVPQYTGLLDAAKQLVMEDGYAGFLKGARARVMVHTPSMAISWGAYEFVKKSLVEHFATE